MMEEMQVPAINELEETKKLLHQTAFTLSGMTQHMGILEEGVKRQEVRINSLEERMSAKEKKDDIRWEQLEASSEITTEQVARVKDAVTARVLYILGEGLGLKYEDQKKYRRRFFTKAWTDVKHFAHVSRYPQIKSGDYEPVIDYIGKWEPEMTYKGNSGIVALQRRIDDEEAGII